MSQFEENIMNTYGERGKAWLAELPELVQKAAEMWDLTDLKPIENLSYNYVLTCMKNEQPVILKLTLDPDRLKKEVCALKAFLGYGAVPVLATTETALLLERILPGYSLNAYLPHKKEEALHIICKIMKRLYQAPLKEITLLPHIKDLLTTLDKEWNIPKNLLEKARALKNSLLQIGDTPVLLHGDLHHNNILSNDAEWWVIDPQGIIGYPVNEVWAFIIDPIHDTQYIADFFKYNVRTVREWYFVHLILTACWNINDNQNPAFFIKLAHKIYPILGSSSF